MIRLNLVFFGDTTMLKFHTYFSCTIFTSIIEFAEHLLLVAFCKQTFYRCLFLLCGNVSHYSSCRSGYDGCGSRHHSCGGSFWYRCCGFDNLWGRVYQSKSENDEISMNIYYVLIDYWHRYTYYVLSVG